VSGRSCHVHRGEAFTLIEMMAVLVLIAMVMGLAMFRADMMTPKFEMNKVAGDIANYLRDARNRAIISSKVVQAEIHPESHEIRCFFENPAVAADDPSTPAPEPFAVRTWSDRVSVEKAIIGGDEVPDRPIVLRFWPTGLCSPVRLYLMYDQKTLPTTVRINPLTGQTVVISGFEPVELYEKQPKPTPKPSGK
jgi:type II secretion system protein H